jgi:hypothetical protein
VNGTAIALTVPHDFYVRSEESLGAESSDSSSDSPEVAEDVLYRFADLSELPN